MFDFAQIQQLPLTIVLPTVVVEGTFRAHLRRLTDVMNEPDNIQMVLTDVCFTDVSTGRKTPRVAVARIDTREALIAHTTVPTEGSEQQRTSKLPIRANVLLPPFTVTGSIHLVYEGELRTAIMSLTDRWVPVTGARYYCGGSSLEPVSADLLVVNNAKAHLAVATEDEWKSASPPSLADRPANPW